jgi:hypothetical protein
MAREAAERMVAGQTNAERVRSDLKVLTWMVGANSVLTATILIRLFTA